MNISICRRYRNLEEQKKINAIYVSPLMQALVKALAYILGVGVLVYSEMTGLYMGRIDGCLFGYSRRLISMQPCPCDA